MVYINKRDNGEKESESKREKERERKRTRESERERELGFIDVLSQKRKQYIQ